MGRKISKGTESLSIIISFCTCKLMCLSLLHDRLKIMSSNIPPPPPPKIFLYFFVF